MCNWGYWNGGWPRGPLAATRANECCKTNFNHTQPKELRRRQRGQTGPFFLFPISPTRDTFYHEARGKNKRNLFGKVQDDREQQLQQQQQRQRRGRKIYDGGGWAKQTTRDARGRGGGGGGGRQNERRK